MIESYPDLLILFKKNDIDIQKKIITKLGEKPQPEQPKQPEQLKEGFVYGFRLECDHYSPKKMDNFYMKLGRTSRTVEQRVNEWRPKLGNIITHFTLFTNDCHKLESLIHLFFSFASYTDVKHSGKEWFYFPDKINIPKIVSLIDELTSNYIEETLEETCEEKTLEEETILININTASYDELIKLTNIGDKKAQYIIEYRERNGKFSSIKDIMNVPYIKQKIFSSIEHCMCV